MGNTNQQLKYMTPLESTSKPKGESSVYVNSLFPQTEKYINEVNQTGIITKIIENFNLNPEEPCFLYKKQVNYEEYEENISQILNKDVFLYAKNLSQSVLSYKLTERQSFSDQVGEWEIFGIYSRNCCEWLITDIALQLNSITSVAFYTTLGHLSFKHIINETKLKTIAVSNENIENLICFYKESKLDSLKNVVLYDLTVFIDKKYIRILTDLGLNVYLFSDLVRSNEKTMKDDSLSQFRIQKPDDILTICYTSGTTSVPKGAMLTQKSFYAVGMAIDDLGYKLDEGEVVISYLPLAHSFERFVSLNAFIRRARIAFMSGIDIKKTLIQNLKDFKPTILFTVPKILINVHRKLKEEINKLPFWKKYLIETALQNKKWNYKKYFSIKHRLYDSLFFSKFNNVFGGRLKIIFVGSAPLPKEIAEEIQLFVSIPIVEGYGLTETCGVSQASYYIDRSNSSLGSCIRCDYLKLVDVNEMNYHSKDEKSQPKGEICYKGPSIFTGYFRNEKGTKEVIDSNGWFHTGDIGMIDVETGGLVLIDRLKEIFKLSQGEYISPSKLESEYLNSKYINQICILGDSLESSIVAIIVINKDVLLRRMKEVGLRKEEEDESFQEEALLKKENFLFLNEEIKKSLLKIADEERFNSLEIPSKFIFTMKEFTVENEMMTPSMKLVRYKIRDYYSEQVKRLYKSEG